MLRFVEWGPGAGVLKQMNDVFETKSLKMKEDDEDQKIRKVKSLHNIGYSIKSNSMVVLAIWTQLRTEWEIHIR